MLNIQRILKYSFNNKRLLTTIQPPPKPERKLTSLELQHLARKGFILNLLFLLLFFFLSFSFFHSLFSSYFTDNLIGKKLTMITAYDYPSAKHAEYADVDIVLVGDSVGMVVLGYDTTQPVTMDDMIYHCKAVRRGAPNRFIVGDMPFGSYEVEIIIF